MKSLERLARAVVAVVIAVILNEIPVAGTWAVIGMAIATYFAVTASTGECLVRDFFLPWKESKRS